MRRLNLFELHDHPRFPFRMRDLVTDALQELWQFGDPYRPILPRLHESLVATGSVQILDLCSGGGGPWPLLLTELAFDCGLPVRVCLTDKYPNRAAFKTIPMNSNSRIESTPLSVDPICVPASLRGFRTIFTAFHHFAPADAKGILTSAIEGNHGIGIFELPRRDVRTLFILCLTPLLVLLLTPRIRPFSWFRFFWTYLIPVVPFVVWYDGLVSCLRAYAPEELKEMVDEIAPTATPAIYRWQVGEEHSGLLPVTYLIGYPLE